MDLNAFSAKSGDMVLAEVDPKFKRFEGDVPREKRISVVVKTVTAEDKMRRSALFAKKETKYFGDGDARLAAIADVVTDDVERRKMQECYWLLEAITNLERGGMAVFHTLPVRDMKLAEFEKIWGGLPPELTDAIHVAVLRHNPIWDPERQGE